MKPEIIYSAASLREYLRGKGRIALVPTMGALHAGHMALVRAAHAAGDHVVVWIFVNPAQFAPHEDFGAYPRDLARDVAAIAALGLDNVTVFAPDVTEIYPRGPGATTIHLGDIDTRWESEFRPHFFKGVALVVTKFFNLIRPDIAVFGEKDFQQLQVVRQLVRDLLMPIEIIGAPTVREDSGLALSSRNAYLTDVERNVIAPKLYAALQAAADKIRAGGDAEKITAQHSQNLFAAGFAKVDYFAYVDAETLAPLSGLTSTKPDRLLVAATLGKARLIDNIAVS